MITAQTVVLGIIGHPIGHSFSPQIHNYFARIFRQQACYAAFNVLPEHLGEAVAGAHSLGIKGLNVTIPHKQTCIDFLSRVDKTARRIAAVNTLVYEQDGYAGYNTDHIGMYMALKAAGIDIRGKSAVIIGAGGTACAACVMAADKGAMEITIANRTLEKAELLADRLKGFFNMPITAVPLSVINDIAHKDIVIQTTSVGMNYPEDCLIESAGFFRGVSAALELIYNPWETKFVKMAKLNHIQALNGFSTLVYQAAASFELWMGINLTEGFLKQAAADLESLAKQA